MPIRVYGSITHIKPDEVHQADGVTLADWIQGQTENYQPGPLQPVTICVNGELIDPERWPDVTVMAADLVDVRVRPQGGWVGDQLSSFAGFILNPFAALSFSAASSIVQSFMPDMPRPGRAGQQGAQVSAAEARANSAKLNRTIPEGFGTHIMYPDYLTRPRRYYKGAKKQALDLTMAIGLHDYDYDPATVKIGDTPVSQLGDVVTYAIHPPGATIPAAYGNWYSSPEVGASTGASGLRLKGYPEEAFDYTDTSATTSGATISAISPPEAWKTGTAFSIDIYQSVTITDGGASADTLDGHFEHLNVLDPVFIRDQSGSFNGATPYFAQVASINAAKTQITLETTGGVPTPITDLPTGTFSLSVFVTGTAYEIASVGATSLSVSATRSGSPVTTPFPSATGVTVNIRVTVDQFDELWAGPFAATPAGEGSGLFEVDIFMPQGLGEIAGSGVNYRTREIEIQWRNRASTSTTWETATRVIEGGTRDQLGFTFPIVTASPSYEPVVRIRRLDAEDLATTSLDRIEWTALRAQLPRADSYPGVTTMTMTIEGSDKIASSSENQINLIATRKLPTWTGTGWSAPVATRDISAAVAQIAKDAGYTDDDIDLDELDRLHTIWTARGDTFDFVFGGTTVRDAINTALRAGMAEMTLAGGLLTPVRDEPRTQFEQPYSPANMTGPLSRSFSTVKRNDFDGVEVEYVDGTTWTTETVVCLLPGDAGIKLEKLKLEGVTDRTRAWRIGMRRRRAQKYRRWTYGFETELDALNSDYLSYVPLLDDIPGYGKASIMLNIEAHPDGALITVNEPMEWLAGQNHVIAYRDVYGDLVGPFAAIQGATEYQIIADIPQPWPDLTARQEPPHVFFGTTERWSYPALIDEITPSGGNRCRVQAVNYDARVYLDDDNSPP